MKNYAITIGLIVLLVFSLTSCSSEPNADEIKRRFESYTPDSSVVAVLDSSTFYFADHTLKLHDISNGESPNNGYLFVDGKLYFSTTKENGVFDFSLFVYSCDLYGKDKHLVFEKHGYKTRPWATGNHGKLYIEYYSTNAIDASARTIDSYNVVTEEYQTEASGKTVHLSDYKRGSIGDYSCSFENNTLSVVDTQKNETYTVSPAELISNTFTEELNGLDWSYRGFYSSNAGKMYFLYRIEASGPQYPHLLCEYIPDSNRLVFSLLYFADDITAFRIENL